MAAPHHNILSKTDRALVAYLLSRNAGTDQDTWPAKRSGDKSLPCTVCWSKRGELDLNTGMYVVDASIQAKSQGAENAGEEEGKPKTESDERVGNVFDAFFTLEDQEEGEEPEWDSKKIAAQITAAARAAAVADPNRYGDLAEFTCLDIRIKGPEAGYDDEASAWIDSLNLELDVVPANVS